MSTTWSRNLKACKDIHHVDRLSSLPDSVLVHILSFLPARDAARTVLIRPFGDLWRTIHTLEFDHGSYFCDLDEDEKWKPNVDLKFIRFVRYFLLLYKSSKIYKFRLIFGDTLATLSNLFAHECSEMEESKLVTEVEMWLRFALAKGVEVLVLEMGLEDGASSAKQFPLHHFSWSDNSLAELRLCNCDLGSPKRVQMGFLRVLELNKTCLGDDAFGKIILGCPLLEDLTIIDCYNLSHLTFMAPNIRTLRVAMCYYRWKLIVQCPYLRSFEFSGIVDCVNLVIISSLENVVFDLKFLDEKFDGFMRFGSFLRRIRHVKVLKLHGSALDVLTHRVFINRPCPCPPNKWKCVVLETWLNRKNIIAIYSLLRSSSHLTELIINVRDSLNDIPEGLNLELNDSRHLWTSSECFIQTLKNVTMNGVLRSSLDAQIDLVQVILKSAPVLDKFCILSKGNVQSPEEDALTSQELFEVSKKLLTLPRACKQAKVFLV